MSKLAITGLSGEVGSFLLNELKNLPENITELFNNTPSQSLKITDHVHLNLLETENIQPTLEQVKPDVILHFAGITHIDACQKDKASGRNGKVWKINVDATAEMVKYCQNTGAKIVYLSTECVFDGEKEFYTENEVTNPINWYGETKAAAEKIILNSKIEAVILRATIAYYPKAKNTLWQKIERSLAINGKVAMANDRWMTPTYLPDIAVALDVILRKNLRGIFHVGPAAALTPYVFAQKVAEYLGYSTETVAPARLSEIIGHEKASLRLKHACLNSDKSKKELGVEFASIEDVIKKI